MLKRDMKEKVRRYLKEANDYINFAEDEAGRAEANHMIDADYNLKKSIANSLMAIAMLLAMKEDFSLPGEFLKEHKERQP